MRIYLYVILATAAITGALVRYYCPRTVEVVQTKTNEVLKHDIVTVIKHEVGLNGTETSTTTITDHSTDSIAKSSAVGSLVPPQWHLGASVGRLELSGANIYGLSVERRLFGPFFGGITANTKHEYGLSLAMEF